MSDRETDLGPRLPAWWTLVRDMGMFLGGWVLVFMEVSRPDVRESVLTFAGTVIGTPGLIAVGSLVTGAIRRRNGTGGSQSESAEPASSPSS